MKKVMFTVSIIITLLSYSIGLTIFGTYGTINNKIQEKRIANLQKEYICLYNEHEKLLQDKIRLHDNSYIEKLSKDYGYVSDDTIIYLPDHTIDSDITIPESSCDYQEGYSASPLAVINNVLLILGSLVIGALTYMILYFIMRRIDRRKTTDSRR